VSSRRLRDSLDLSTGLPLLWGGDYMASTCDPQDRGPKPLAHEDRADYTAVRFSVANVFLTLTASRSTIV
jgi:hypothetical protein